MKIINLFIINLIIFLNPFFFLIFSNLQKYNYYFHLPSLILFISLFLIIYLLIILFFNNRFLKKNIDFIIFYFAILFNFSFFFDFVINDKSYLIRLLILFLFSFSIYLIYLKFKFISKIIFTFVCLYLIFNIIFQIIDKNTNVLKSSNENIINISKKNQNNLILPDLYLIILDEMSSPNYLKEYFNINYNDYITLKNVNVISALSSAKLTHESLSNFFYEDKNFYQENVESGKNYPFNKTNEPNFLKFLKDLNYETFSIGNRYVPCIKVYDVICLNNFSSFYTFNYVIKNTVFTKLIENVVESQIFYLKKYITQTLSKNIYFINELFTENMGIINSNSEIEIDYLIKIVEKNNSYLNSTKNKVFILHNMSPHQPFRNENCNIYPAVDKINNYIKFDRYSTSVKCTLKKVNKLLKELNKLEKDNLIFIFGDHGTEDYASQMNLENFDVNKEYERTNDIFVLNSHKGRCNLINIEINNHKDITDTIRNCIQIYLNN